MSVRFRCFFAVEKVEKVEFYFQKVHPRCCSAPISCDVGGESGLFLGGNAYEKIYILYIYIYKYNRQKSPLSPPVFVTIYE